MNTQIMYRNTAASRSRYWPETRLPAYHGSLKASRSAARRQSLSVVSYPVSQTRRRIGYQSNGRSPQSNARWARVHFHRFGRAASIF